MKSDPISTVSDSEFVYSNSQLDAMADVIYGAFYPNTNPKLTRKARAWAGSPETNPFKRPVRIALEEIFGMTLISDEDVLE